MSRPPKKNKAVRAATLADVGRDAGVSAMAASAVLNGAKTSSRISDETRARILRSAARLNYRPNAAARALLRRRMNTLGVVAHVEGGDLGHYFLEVFNGILETAARHGQNTTVFTLRDWDAEARRIGGFCDGRIDGMVMVAPLLRPSTMNAMPAHTPVVAIHANHVLPGVVNLEPDEEAGSYALVSRLIEMGHRRILHLAGPEGLCGPERRIAGYRRALERAGLVFEPEWVRKAGFDAQTGRKAAAAWLKTKAARGAERPTAIFCVNDSVAYGCLEALAGAGLRVPQDVSVAGFDDTLLARACVPQLSSVRQPLREMGGRAVELLLGLTGGAKAPRSPLVFPTEVVLRASTAAAPAE